MLCCCKTQKTKPQKQLKESSDLFKIFTEFITQLVTSFPKDKKTAATVRKHQVGQKIGAGAGGAGGADGDGMSNIINTLKSGEQAGGTTPGGKKLPPGAQGGGFDPKAISAVSLRAVKK